MPDVFVAHISDHEDIAIGLKRLIRDRLGLDVFVASDVRSMRLGVEWWNTIKAALRASRVLLCVLNRTSLQHAWVPFESGAFWLLDKPVIPVCFGDLLKKEMPHPFAAFQGVDLPDELFRLLTELNEYVEPRRLLLPSLLDDPLEKAFTLTLHGQPFRPPLPPLPPSGR